MPEFISPTVKTLKEAFPDVDDHEQLKYLMAGNIDPWDIIELTIHEERYDYVDQILLAVNHIISGFGVERVDLSRKDGRPACFLYVNMGDTYNTTIVYYKGRFKVSCWGDQYESLKRQGFCDPTYA